MLTTVSELRQKLARVSGETWRLYPSTTPAVTVFDPAPYQVRLQRVAEEFGFTIHPCADDDSAYARVGGNQIFTTWPLKTERDAATATHEAGHMVQPRCSGPDHYRDPSFTDTHACIACEVSAWTLGIVLLRPLPWTEGMHARLNDALGGYRRSVKGQPHALAQLDRLTTDLTFLRIKQLAVEASMRPAKAMRTLTWEEAREEDRWRDIIDGFKHNQGAHDATHV